MKRTVFTFVFFTFLAFSAFAQKKVGTIYEEHDNINRVEALWKAFVAGDASAVERYFADSVYLITNGGEGEYISRADFTKNMSWWQTSFEDLDIYQQEPAYPDALEYKNGGVWVQDWTVLSGRHTETGIQVELPVHRLYAFDEDNKIGMMISYFDDDIFEEISRAQTTRENGEVYINHPYIATTRKLVNAFRDQDVDAYVALFSEDARVGFSWYEFGKTQSIQESGEGLRSMFSNGYKAKIEETGYPDCIFYEEAGAYVVYSWWKHTVEKDGKKYSFPLMLAHTYNDDGEIVFEYVYGSSNHFE